MINIFSQSNFPVLPIAWSVTKSCLRANYTKQPLLVIGAILIGLLETAPLVPTHAQAATSIIQTTGAGDLGTQVLPPSGNVYGITGGTPAGTNLYHSFAQFNVGTGDIAQFQTLTLNPDTAMLNILGRITDANPSTIFGTIDSASFYPSANLFLMNPYGFLFGPGAMVNVGGMVSFTTANYLRLTVTGIFHADQAATSVLTSAPVAAFGFLGSNPTAPAAISIQGSTLAAPGQTISLVGGNQGFNYTNPDTGDTASVLDGMTMTGGHLSAQGGQINFVSVASAGEVLNGTLEPAPNINGNVFTTMGDISLSQGATLTVSGDAAGTIRIRGGQFVIADATISADTVNSPGAQTAVDIKVAGDLLISDTRGLPILTATTTGHGDAGSIEIKSANLVATSTSSPLIPFALIDSHTSGAEKAGIAGDINIMTGNLQASNQGPGIVQFTDSGTVGLGHGHGGNVTISAQSVTLEGGAGINTGDTMAAFPGYPFQDANGSAGNVTITADRLTVLFSGIDTSALLASDPAELAGSVTLNASDINLTTSAVSALGFGGGGAFTIIADRLIMDGGTQLQSLTASGPGGGILVKASIVELQNASSMATTTVGDGQAGDIHVTATDHLTLSTSPFDNNPSGFFSNSTGVVGDGLGPAGTIVVTTPRLDMTGGSRINTITLSSGPGGDVTINATNSVSISGEFPSVPLETIFGVGTIHPSGIFTGTAVGDVPCSGPCGDAGQILLTTGSLVLGNGAQIDSSTNTNGRGGDITIHAMNGISMSGTLNDGSPVGVFSRSIGTEQGSGSGGNVAISAGQSVAISSGASVSASSTGAGDAGNVTIQGLASHTQSVLIDGSGIFTDTQGTGAGGNIFVSANSVTLQNGGALSATTSGTQATATGGTITVHANQVQLNDQATITATSTRLFDKPNSGAGNAGTITVTAEESIVLLGNSSITSSAGAEGNGGLVSLTAPSIELHGNSNIGTSTAGLGNAGNIELQGNQVNLRTDSFVTARTQAEGRGGNITIRGLTGEGSRATDISLSDNSQLVSETIGDGEHIQGAAGNILIETARLNLSGGSLFNTTSRGSTGAAGNIIVNATDSLTISGHGTQLVSDSMEFSFGDAGNISISAPSVVIENNGGISTSTSLVGNAGTITVKTNNLQLLSGGHITSSSLAEVPELSSGAAGTVSIQGLASPAQSVFIDGPASGIFTDTRGSGLGGNITLNANTVALQDGGALSAKTSGTAPSATGGTITIDAADTFSMSNRASINASSPGGADAGSINITAMNGFTMQNSTITTEAGQGAGGGDIKVTTSPDATVLLQNSKISASVADGSGGGGNISIDPQFVILQNSQILAQAAQGQGGAITITTNLFLSDANSIVNADSGSGVNGTITIQSPNAPISGQIQPLGKTPLIATTLLNQHCAALAGGQFSSFTVAGRDSLPTEPGSWLASPLYAGGVGTGEGLSGLSSLSRVSGVVRGGLAAHQIDQTNQINQTNPALLSLRQIAPAGFLSQAFAVEGSSSCQS